MTEAESVEEAMEKFNEALHQACVDGGLISKGNSIPDDIPKEIVFAAMILLGFEGPAR